MQHVKVQRDGDPQRDGVPSRGNTNGSSAEHIMACTYLDPVPFAGFSVPYGSGPTSVTFQTCSDKLTGHGRCPWLHDCSDQERRGGDP